MPIIDFNLTGISVEHAQSEPGMAHFAGSGPPGKRCAECVFWGYKKLGKPRFNQKTQEEFEPMQAHDGCRKFFELTGRHGPTIKPDLLACKYFKQNKTVEGAPPPSAIKMPGKVRNRV